jgi:hypothetical protein
MKSHIKNIECQGSRFFVLQDMENLEFGFEKFELSEIKVAEDLSPAEKKIIVRSLQEYGLESKLAGSIIRSEIRYLLLGWN